MRRQKRKGLPGSLLRSGLALVLSLALMAGFTLAWFTNVVSSKNNVIASGTLKLLVTGSEDLLDLSVYDPAFDLSNNSLIEEQNWKPGDTGKKFIKIENVGSLPLQYKIYLRINGVVPGADLAEVIKVRAVEVPEKSPVDFEKEKTLSYYDQEYGQIGIPIDKPTLDVNEAILYQLDYLFCPWAGNTYQGKELNVDFVVGAIQQDHAMPDDIVFVSTLDELLDQCDDSRSTFKGKEGSTIIFLNDIEDENASGVYDLVKFNVWHNFDLNGYRLNIPNSELNIDIEGGCAMDIANECIVADKLTIKAPSGVVNFGNAADGTLCLFIGGKFVDDPNTVVDPSTIFHDEFLEPCADHNTIKKFNITKATVFNTIGDYRVILEGTVEYSDGTVSSYSETLEDVQPPTPQITGTTIEKYNIKIEWDWKSIPLPPPFPPRSEFMIVGVLDENNVRLYPTP